METYGAIYDAVRSKIQGGDICYAIQEVARQAFEISGITQQASNAISNVEMEYLRPSVMFRPSVMPDGNAWVALYGENLQDGVTGCGDSPEAAMRDFDKTWTTKMKG